MRNTKKEIAARHWAAQAAKVAVSKDPAKLPAKNAPTAAAVIFKLAPVVNTWLRNRSGASRCRTAKIAASCGPSAIPAMSIATRATHMLPARASTTIAKAKMRVVTNAMLSGLRLVVRF